MKKIRDRALHSIDRTGKVRTISELPQAVLGVALAIIYLADCVNDAMAIEKAAEPASDTPSSGNES